MLVAPIMWREKSINEEKYSVLYINEKKKTKNLWPTLVFIFKQTLNINLNNTLIRKFWYIEKKNSQM